MRLKGGSDLSKAVLSGATGYLEVPVGVGTKNSLFIWWDDTTTHATLTFQSTNRAIADVSPTSTNAEDWAAETAVDALVTSPPGGSKSCCTVHLPATFAAARLRVKIVAAANSTIHVHAGAQ